MPPKLESFSKPSSACPTLFSEALLLKPRLCALAHVAPKPRSCFHGIMSRGSEDNFDLGLRVNVDSIRLMLDAARNAKAPELIKFIFTSSLAVYGGELVRFLRALYTLSPAF